MIKVTIRIIVILLVAAIVSAGLYALVQNGASSARFRPERQFNPSGANNAQVRPEGFRGEGRDFGGSASIGRGLAGIIVTLLQISAITFIVVQFQKAFRSPRRTT